MGASEGEGERRGERGGEEPPSIGGGVVGDKPPFSFSNVLCNMLDSS